MEIIPSGASMTKKVRVTINNILFIVEDISRKKEYINRLGSYSFLSHSLISYILQVHCHTRSIDTSKE